LGVFDTLEEFAVEVFWLFSLEQDDVATVLLDPLVLETITLSYACSLFTEDVRQICDWNPLLLFDIFPDLEFVAAFCYYAFRLWCEYDLFESNDLYATIERLASLSNAALISACDIAGKSSLLWRGSFVSKRSRISCVRF